MAQLDRHAIVIGASIGGLLAAALADHYEGVTVLERDALPEARAGQRSATRTPRAWAMLPQHQPQGLDNE